MPIPHVRSNRGPCPLRSTVPMHYLIAYDIANPCRLRRVARLLERRGVRLQKSVFLFQGDGPALDALLDEIAALLKLKEDVVQAWQISKQQPAAGTCRGT